MSTRPPTAVLSYPTRRKNTCQAARRPVGEAPWATLSGMKSSNQADGQGSSDTAADQPRGAEGAYASVSAELPEDVLERVRRLCLTFPEVTVRIDESRTQARSTAYSFDIRGKSFCLLVAKQGRSGTAVPLLVLRADPEEHDAFVSMGHPYFALRTGRGRIGVLLTKDADWQEIRELVTESYRLLAPKKLIALLD